MTLNKNRILSGSEGKVWLNSEILAFVEKVEIKMTGKFEEITCCGDYATYNKYVGWSGSGTVTIKKINSDIMSQLAQSYSSGEPQELQIVTSVTDIVTGKSERISISEVEITEVNLTSFEAQKIVSMELPFTFSSYQILEKI